MSIVLLKSFQKQNPILKNAFSTPQKKKKKSFWNIKKKSFKGEPETFFFFKYKTFSKKKTCFSIFF